ncbi:MAG TPA: subclass B1 metallo-beta-lactamase [Bacteroidales bacterium]|nr:subclass B1 metallo-beta-lactamase [Bacteroidales bacterium]
MRSVLLIIIAFLCRQSFSQDRIRVSDDIELIKLSENAYIHVTYNETPSFGRYSSNGLIFIDKGKAFLFDTPVTGSQTDLLCTWIEKNLNVRIEGFVPNHWHEDCMGGIAYLKNRRIPTYANQITIDIAKTKNLPQPDYGFSDSLILNKEGNQVLCIYPGAAHSTDNIIVWIESEKILFAGCMCKSIDTPNLGNTADGDIKAYPVTIDRVIKRFPYAEIVIPGHGAYGGRELLFHTLSLSQK